MIDKLHPHNLELESAVLGAMLLEKDKIHLVIDTLTDGHFYKQEHKYIYEAIKQLYKLSEPIDILTVTNHLREINRLDLIGGAYFIAQLTARVASAANIEFHSKILTEYAIKRNLISISDTLNRKAYEDDTNVLELLESTGKALFDIKTKTFIKNAKELDNMIFEAIQNIEQRNQDIPVGIASGLSTLDTITGGWQNGNLIIVAGRPGMGKSILGLMAANHSAINLEKPTAIFSLEMTDIELMYRLFSMRGDISNNKLQSEVLTDYEIAQVKELGMDILGKKLFIDDTPGLSLFDFRTKARRLKSLHNIELIVVDYIQLMTNYEKGQNRESEISSISRGLKIVAKELNVPVIALAQLSREVEKRSDKKPQLSDLRESGGIEQDANVVLFISPNGDDDFSKIISIAKNRNGGANQDIEVHHEKRLVRFENKRTF